MSGISKPLLYSSVISSIIGGAYIIKYVFLHMTYFISAKKKKVLETNGY